MKARRAAPDNDALEDSCDSPDRDGLFAAIVMTLDRKGCGIHRARVLDAPNAAIFDTFEVLPADSFADGEPEHLAAALREALASDPQRLRPSRRVVPRQLRHFRFAPRIDFNDSAGGRRTRLSLVAPDRPGLLADVAQVFAQPAPARPRRPHRHVRRARRRPVPDYRRARPAPARRLACGIARGVDVLP